MRGILLAWVTFSITLYYLYERLCVSQIVITGSNETILMGQSSVCLTHLVRSLPSFGEPFKPTLWLWNGHFQVEFIWPF
jgi:hypothetical protein